MSGPRHTASIGGHKQGRESESDKDGPNTVAPAIKFGEGTITSAVQDFLERLHPGAPRTITVFKPRPDGLTVPGGRRGLVDAWISERDGVSDLYVLPGLVKGHPSRQPKKEHMLGSLWLWADLDPRAGEDEASERERILALLTSQLPVDVPPPTIIVDSGRGFWALWELAEPCMEAARVETANLGLANAFGAVGDKCWNINRVMRLAGTKNLKTGRRAKVVADEPGRVYPIDQFRAAETPPVSPSGGPPRGGNRHGAPGGAGEDSPGPASVADLSELDRWRVPDRVRVIINQGHHPDQPKGDDNTRSAWLYDVVCNLLRCGVPDETILGIITDQSWAISESVLDKGRRAAQYAQRQIEEARAETVALDHTRLDHAGVQGQEHNLGIQVFTGLQGGCEALFHRFRKTWIVALGETLRTQHAVAEKLSCGRARGRVQAGSGLPEQLQCCELYCFRHEPRVEAHAEQRLVEMLEVAGAAENAEQAEHEKEANTPAILREDRTASQGRRSSILQSRYIESNGRTGPRSGRQIPYHRTHLRRSR